MKVKEHEEIEAVIGQVKEEPMDDDLGHPDAHGSRVGPRGADGQEADSKMEGPERDATGGDAHAVDETGMKRPEVPSVEEVLSHLRRGQVSLAAWRLECMTGRGQEDPHFDCDPDHGAIVVRFDFGYLGPGEESSRFRLTLVVVKCQRADIKVTENMPIVSWLVRHRMLEFGVVVMGKDQVEPRGQFGMAWCRGHL